MTETESIPLCFYFGCWGRSGHEMRGSPRNVRVGRETGRALEWFGNQIHIDGSLAPRELLEYRNDYAERHRTGCITWYGSGVTRRDRDRIKADSVECPQGQFLLHSALGNGYTAIQWWDRTQGDTRGACNSTVLLQGVRTAAEMVAAVELHFPQVVENLRKAGIALVEVQASPKEVCEG